jgi:hypothetical protein
VQRLALLFAASFCGAVGVRAMFRTNNEGATTVLITGALALALLAILGEMPLRGSIGSFNWDMARRLLRSSDEKVSTAAAKEVLAEARSKNVPDDVLASAQRSLRHASLDYEKDVFAALIRVAGQRGWRVELPQRDAVRTEVDAVMVASESKVLIEVKYGATSSANKAIATWSSRSLRNTTPIGAITATRLRESCSSRHTSHPKRKQGSTALRKRVGCWPLRNGRDERMTALSVTP